MACKIINCTILASYGLKETKIKEFCKKHKTQDMIYLSKCCEYQQCLIVSSFGYIINSKKQALRCKEHKLEDMISINQLCKYENCNNRARYNYISEKGSLYCNEHKLKNMIDKNKNICIKEECNNYANYNFKNIKKAIYCQEHKENLMVDKRQKICKFESCLTQAYYGTKKDKQLYCVQHKLDTMYDYRSPRCPQCNLFLIKHQNKLCSYCNPNKYVKTKELLVYNFLKDKMNFNFIYNKNIGFSCGNFRPDFKIDCNTHYIIIEVDENQHKQYDKNCELIRMNNIYIANGLPTIFIRFNPDNCNNIKIHINNKLKLLMQIINQYKSIIIDNISDNISDTGIKLIYLYYDCECKECNFIHEKEFKILND